MSDILGAKGTVMGMYMATTTFTKLRTKPSTALISSQTEQNHIIIDDAENDNNNKMKMKMKMKKKKRVFFLDVKPICYNGSTPSLHSFAHWISLFFSQVTFTDPVIAVSFPFLFSFLPNVT